MLYVVIGLLNIVIMMQFTSYARVSPFEFIAAFINVSNNNGEFIPASINVSNNNGDQRGIIFSFIDNRQINKH
jgi:hypothetical protein